MDLGAYIQIEDLDKIAKDNGIEVSRLRGYRLMKDEKPVSIPEQLKCLEADVCGDLIESSWTGFIYSFGDTVKRNKKRYMTYHYEKHTREDGTEFSWIVYDGVKWNKIHGKHRKQLKFAIKKSVRATKTQWEMWNKYCGRADVLHIHARLGSCNWSYIVHTDYKNEPWYMESCDDS